MSVAQAMQLHKQDVLQLRGLVDRDLVSLLTAVEGLPVAKVRNTLIGVLPELVGPYMAASGELAAVLFEDLRAEAGRRGTFYADATVEPLSVARVDKTVRWAVDPLVNESLESTVFSRLAGSTARMVSGASRRVVADNGVRDAGQMIRFQRMPSPGSCTFCGMLASRPVYMHYRTGFTGGSGNKLDGGSGDHFHDDCRCTVMPIYPGTEMAQLADATQKKYERMYQQSQTFEDGTAAVTTKQKLAAWREYHGTK